MKKEFTKGEWKIDPLNRMSIIDDSGSAFNGLICQVNGKGLHESNANAKLISAAPEMLEALHLFLSCKTEADYQSVKNTAKSIISKVTE